MVASRLLGGDFVGGEFFPQGHAIVEKKNVLYLSVNVFSTKVLIGNTTLRVLMETGPPFYVVIRATQRSRRLQCKEKTMSNGPAPRIEPATSLSAVKCSTA